MSRLIFDYGFDPKKDKLFCCVNHLKRYVIPTLEEILTLVLMICLARLKVSREEWTRSQIKKAMQKL